MIALKIVAKTVTDNKRKSIEAPNIMAKLIKNIFAGFIVFSPLAKKSDKKLIYYYHITPNAKKQTTIG